MSDGKVCVVSLIGKSQFLQNQSKAWKLNSLLQKDFFKPSYSSAQSEQADSTEDNFDIQTYHDTKNRVIYIHLESIYDTCNVLDNFLKQKDDSKNFFELWEKENTKYVKSILLLFSVSHIILISSPSCEFDIGYIRFFRIVETLRNKMLPSVVETLKSLNLPIGKEWIYAGRPCSPRVLFTFENCPKDILSDFDVKHSKSIEKLQHSLEDQIYNSLRKSYVITNISNNSLFAIPANQEFAYIHRLTYNSIDTNRFLLATLHKECSKFKETSTNQRNFAKSNYDSLTIQNSLLPGNFLSDSLRNNESLDASLFRKFVFQHIDTALTDGFNDNIGRTNVYPVFELPRASNWDKVFDALCELFLSEPKTTKIQSQYAQLKSQIDIDAQFSENRCKKQMPAALNLYQEGLPSHYTKSQHNQRLDKAIQLFSLHGRGPMFNTYLKQLTVECENIWQNGRQLCEAISLNGHPCVYELHLVGDCESNKAELKDDQEISEIEEESANEGFKSQNEDNYEVESRYQSSKSRSRSIKSGSENRDGSLKKMRDRHSSDNSRNGSSFETKKPLSIKNHNSNIITIAASNCGEFQLERTDPFDLKEANFTYYEDFATMASSAKKKQIRYDFQTFRPSSVSYRPEEIHEYQTTQQFINSDSTSLNLSQEEQFPKLSKQSNINPVQIRSNHSKCKDIDSLFPSPLVSEQKLKNKNLYTDIVVTPNDNENDNASSSIATSNQHSISPVRSGLIDSLKANTIASTEVYLAGMNHSENPPGLLPLYSSWSLISIGKSTQYNPQTGLNQPGFLPNHNYLIPWDIVINKGALGDKSMSQTRKNTSGYNKKNSLKTPEANNLWSSDNNQSNSQAAAPIVVKVYIGMEYECPCGHRFICSGPDRIVKVSSNGNVKDDAYKLLNGDMPLYTACPCRNSKDTTPYMAQMMRVFIVTPYSTIHQAETSIDYKGSLLSSSPTQTKHLSLNQASNSKSNRIASSQLQIVLKPRVQPNPTPCPIFWPSNNQSPIYLAENSIWVLRLPYIYMGDKEKPYYRPKDFETLNNCRVLKGMFSILLNSDGL